MTINNIVYYMGIVILFIIFFYFVYLATSFIAKMNKSYNSGKNITIIEKVIIGTGIYLLIVEVDNVNYLLSVTKDKVDLIDTIDNLKNESFKKNNEKMDFSSVLLNKLKSNKKKRK